MHPEGGRRPWCSAKYNQHPPCVAKNIPTFYPGFTSERWTLIELRRLDNVLVWQSEFRCPCPDPKDVTTTIGFGHRSRGYILKGSLGLPTMPMENYQETCLFLYVSFMVNSRETSKGSIPGEQLWVGM